MYTKLNVELGFHKLVSFQCIMSATETQTNSEVVIVVSGNISVDRQRVKFFRQICFTDFADSYHPSTLVGIS